MVKRRGTQQTGRAYTRSLFGVLSLALIPLIGNSLVDPLWYFSGNHFGPNYPFNERISKANQLHGNEKEYDCLILGSSRSTLLDVRDIQGRKCFNFAVSQARFADELQLAEYAKERGLNPRTIIIALDGFNFSKPLAFFRNPMPPFIESAESPPNFVATYLSVDATEFSWKTILRQPPNDRYYDSRFAARALPGSGPFEPERPLNMPELVEQDPNFDQFSLGPFEVDESLGTLRRIFPHAVLLGYVPPVATQWVAKLHLAGTLKSYLEVIFESTKYFDEVYDFSIPSPITRDPENTYDGSHFYRDINRLVAGTLSKPSRPSSAAVSLKGVGKSDYEKQFESAVLKYIQEVGVASSTADARRSSATNNLSP